MPEISFDVPLSCGPVNRRVIHMDIRIEEKNTLSKGGGAEIVIEQQAETGD